MLCTVVNTYVQFVGNFWISLQDTRKSLLPKDGGNKILQTICNNLESHAPNMIVSFRLHHMSQIQCTMFLDIIYVWLEEPG
jgi:hypothetical protein